MWVISPTKKSTQALYSTMEGRGAGLKIRPTPPPGTSRQDAAFQRQNYNDNIKAAFKVAGITRLITELDPVTRKEVKHPLNEIASSHLARRTFAGNIYRQVKDPNLVASLTGHAEGSRAFNRYREIDLGMKQDLVRILENKK